IIADSVAAFVGFAHGDLTLQNLRAGKKGGADFIKNCQAAAGIAARIYSGKGDADGKTGEYGKLIVENCENNVAITGIAGNGDTIAYKNSQNAYNPGGNDKTGGIICDARYYSEMLITKCVNNAKLTGHNVGGIVGARQGTGSMVSPSRITECANYGEIAARSYGGGIIGFRNVEQNGSNAVYVISDCTNYGKLTYRSYDYKGTGELLKTVSGLGGIVGYFNLKSANALIVNCANYGDIEISNVSNSIGGIVGAIDVNNLNNGKLTLSNCFNAGTLSCENGNIKISEDLIYGQVINKASTVKIDSFLYLYGLVNAGSFKNLSQA
ncbi:MAG: hypothetical protein K2I20_04245, partial [Clostridia bacterium]|nr:hypothetical protein [Clostridia bacterium]